MSSTTVRRPSLSVSGGPSAAELLAGLPPETAARLLLGAIDASKLPALAAGAAAERAKLDEQSCKRARRCAADIRRWVGTIEHTDGWDTGEHERDMRRAERSLRQMARRVTELTKR